jgi:hypothetical protein
VKELHETALRQDTCLAHAIGWVHHLGSLANAAATNDPTRDKPEERKSTMADVGQLTSLVDLRQRENARLTASLADRDRQISALRASSRQPSVATDRSQGSANGRRSAKLDGPGIYKGDGNDSVTFEYWFRQVKNNLAVNADYFDDDDAKRIYIESRLGGTAAQDLEPYLEEGHPNQIVTSAQLLTHLWSQYRNPNKSENAIREYSDLIMEPTDDFFRFKNTFVRLAGECRKPKAEWKI